jgi:glycosyltransferase involved in cell wall biosynthesis
VPLNAPDAVHGERVARPRATDPRESDLSRTDHRDRAQPFSLRLPERAPKRSIVVVINALHSGGTEKTCIEVARHFSERYHVKIVSLTGGGPAESELRGMGVQVEVLRASNPLSAIFALVRLGKVLREYRPEVILTFLYFSDLAGSLTARIFAPHSKVYWNVRNNVLTRRQTGFSYYAAKLCAWTSHFLPHEIVYCSETARTQHEAIGYRPARSAVVENSAGAVPFSFSREARGEFRRGRFDGAFVFLFVGRFDAVKRVDVYIEACARVYRSSGEALRFAIAGRGMDPSNVQLLKMITATGCADRFELLGFVEDRQRLYSAADCLVLTSETEGSPNVVYEAVATKLPAIILGTIGTEGVRSESVYRIGSRDLESLVSAMRNHARSAAPDPVIRHSKRPPITAHPLATYYGRLL